MDTVYKVVSYTTTNTSVLFSAAAREQAAVQYKEGEKVFAPSWLAAKGYHLTAFENEAAAWAVYRPGLHHGTLVLYKAFGYDKVLLPGRLNLAYITSERTYLEEVLGNYYFPDFTNYAWPDGTVMYKALTLIEPLYHARRS